VIKPVREKVVRNVKENLSLLKQKLVMKKSTYAGELVNLDLANEHVQFNNYGVAGKNDTYYFGRYTRPNGRRGRFCF